MKEIFSHVDRLYKSISHKTELTCPNSPASIGGGFQRAAKSSMDSANTQWELNLPLNVVSFKEERDRQKFIVKAVLLKYLIDNDYIGEYEKLKENFTVNQMIKLWSGHRYQYFTEESLPLLDNEWNVLVDFMNCSSSLKGKNSNILGYVYEYISSREDKKLRGMFYTPQEIILHMLSLLDINYSKTFTIMDPACGSGFFLSQLYDFTMDHTKNISTESRLDLHKRIIKEQLFGIEKDPLAALISKLVLNLKYSVFIPIDSIKNQDALLTSRREKYDYIIGNPPYIGHKAMDHSTFEQIKDQYKDVFYDKGDVHFCFFKKGIELLKANGKLIFIISRYFLESLNGKGLRSYLVNNSNIELIIDYNGNRPIKGAKVDLAILLLSKAKESKTNTMVYKVKEGLKNKKYQEIFEDSTNYQAFTVKQEDLSDEPWILLSTFAKSILQKVHGKGHLPLQSICTSNQGVITGRDKAFVVDNDENLFKWDLLKPWIKSSNICKYFIEKNDKYLLYTDEIEDIHLFPEIEGHLLSHKEKLSSRRECKNGIRKWYMLQWGRNPKNFEGKKIVFPYKAAHNRFAIDEKGYYFSADVYGLVLREALWNQYSYETLVCILNSKLYEFYFKSFAKKLGGKLYEYYPNTLMKLMIPKVDEKWNGVFIQYYKRIIRLKKANQMDKTHDILIEIDDNLYDYFNINGKERKLIETSIL